MREVLICDVLAMARVLCAYPRCERAGIARRIVKEVNQADDHRRRFLRAHPTWGDGSITARALAMDKGMEPDAITGDYLASLVIAAVVLRQSLI